MELNELVDDIALAIKVIDQRQPQASNARSGARYQPGIGPHPETQAVALVVAELPRISPDRYGERIKENVAYPAAQRQKCDVCIGTTGEWEWSIEVKMLRMMGDNGKPNDNMIAHILSPYPSQRSALTDCSKLLKSGFDGRTAILIYGFDYPDFNMNPVIDAFETLAAKQVRLGERHEAHFSNLCHPVHQTGRVFGWELLQLS